MKIDYIREFVALAETLNFSKTAERLFITQSALSRHIVYIEEVAGVRLLIRNTHNVELTLAGEKLLEGFRFLLHKYDESIYQTSLESSGYTGECKLGILYYSVQEHIDPIVTQFKILYPNIKLSFLSCQPPYVMEHLLNGSIDIGQYIYWKNPNTSDHSERKLGFEYFGSNKLGKCIEEKIRFHNLGLEGFILVVSKDSLLAKRNLISIQELNDPLFIFFEGNRFDDYARELLNLTGISYRQHLVCGQIDILSLVIKETGGMALQPKCVRYMHRDTLHYIDVEDDSFRTYMCLAYKMDNNNPAIPLFINAISKVHSPYMKEKSANSC